MRMRHTEAGELSYTELERRIKALPDGPAAVLNTPRPFAILGVIGNVGIILGLLPSLLITFMPPREWMLWIAQAGLAIAVLGCAPEFFRSIWVVGRSMRNWRTNQVSQLDHDIVQFRELVVWLRRYPTEQLAEYLRFTRRTQTRLSAKIGLMAGGIDKLGIAPLLIALGIQIKAFVDWGQTPLWQILLGLFLAIAYMVAFMGVLMRLRLQLYETVLEEALQSRATPGRGPES